VLIGDAGGKPRYDFTGRLSFLWPNGPEPAATDRAGKHPQTWPLGYGLGYAPQP
jgi:beta-glucosidase